MRLYKRNNTYYIYVSRTERISTGLKDYDSAKTYLENYSSLSWERFRDIVIEWVTNSGLDPATIDNYERVIDRMISLYKKKPLDLKPLDFELYKSVRRGIIKPSSLNAELRKIRASYGILKRLGIGEVPYIQNVIEPKVMPLALNDRECELLIENLNRPYKQYVIFALNTGLRLRECISIDSTNINGEFIEVRTKANFKVKKDKFRRVPINSKCRDILDVVINNKRNACWVSYNVKSAMNRLGFNSKYNFHTLRKTFATNCVRAGMNIYDLAEILGHNDVATTKIYYQPDLNNARGIMERI